MAFRGHGHFPELDGFAAPALTDSRVSWESSQLRPAVIRVWIANGEISGQSARSCSYRGIELEVSTLGLPHRTIDPRNRVRPTARSLVATACVRPFVRSSSGRPSGVSFAWAAVRSLAASYALSHATWLRVPELSPGHLTSNMCLRSRSSGLTQISRDTSVKTFERQSAFCETS